MMNRTDGPHSLVAEFLLHVVQVNSLQLGERVENDAPGFEVQEHVLPVKFPFGFPSLVPEYMCDLPPGENRGIRQVGERNGVGVVVVVVVLGQVAPEGEGYGEGEGAGGGEYKARHVEVTCEVVGPAEEEIGDDGFGR